MNTELEIIKLVTTLLLGGVVGAFLAHYLTTVRSAIELTTSIAENYIEEFLNYQSALTVFQTKPATTDNGEVNLARRAADWWEIVAAYRATKLINHKLFKRLGLETQLFRFRDAVTTASTAANSRFQDARNLWPNLFAAQ